MLPVSVLNSGKRTPSYTASTILFTSIAKLIKGMVSRSATHRLGSSIVPLHCRTLQRRTYKRVNATVLRPSTKTCSSIKGVAPLPRCHALQFDAQQWLIRRAELPPFHRSHAGRPDRKKYGHLRHLNVHIGAAALSTRRLPCYPMLSSRLKSRITVFGAQRNAAPLSTRHLPFYPTMGSPTRMSVRMETPLP